MLPFCTLLISPLIISSRLFFKFTGATSSFWYSPHRLPMPMFLKNMEASLPMASSPVKRAKSVYSFAVLALKLPVPMWVMYFTPLSLAGR